MATVHYLLPTSQEFYAELQNRADYAKDQRLIRFKAVLVLQRMTRGYLIRKHIAWLAKNAIIIQCAFRVHQARKAYRAALRRAVQNKHAKHYAVAASKIQALWRGHLSRKTKFCYRRYRLWLATVTERGERKAAEAAEFGARTKADNLKILENEARTWLAFVVFKLHHLLRTYVCAGIYSDRESNKLTEFEKLLRSIQYTEYMKRLRCKYNKFVRKHRPMFSNKRLFPIIGDGAEYWYLSLPEMYELTSQQREVSNTRHQATHHGPIHKEPFLWKQYRVSVREGKGPFTLQPIPRNTRSKLVGPIEKLQNISSGDGPSEDPRFNLYVMHYTPQPAVFDYIDFHINVLLKRRNSIENMDVE